MAARILALLESGENSDQVAASLNRSGHHVTVSKTFTNAIRMLQHQHFDLVISDVHLENGGNVFDFLRWVRRNASTRQTPFVMFSCQPTTLAKYVEDGVRTAARMLGSSKFITMHTFDSNEFRKQIESLLPDANQAKELSTKGKQ